MGKTKRDSNPAKKKAARAEGNEDLELADEKAQKVKGGAFLKYTDKTSPSLLKYKE